MQQPGDSRERRPSDLDEPTPGTPATAIGVSPLSPRRESALRSPGSPVSTGLANSGRPYAPSCRAARFVYGDLSVDAASGELRCSYQLDQYRFTEIISFGPDKVWSPAALEAARLVHLLAGVSYFKAGAPRVIDLGYTVLRPGEREFLRRYYLGGLGEYAYVNGLDLDDLVVVGGADKAADKAVRAQPAASGPLVPFGGGIDSLISTDVVAAARSGTALYVNNTGVAIERAAAATGLPIVRTRRLIDPVLIRMSRASAVLNGHVPITAILSAIAVCAAALDGRPEVVMSNEWSASQGNLEVNGRIVNHQYSKSAEYERDFRAVLSGCLGLSVDWFSLLRPFSELWVARRFAGLTQYHPVVHSCNEAFYLDEGQRLDHWCGRCDKCCFIDLVLAPFTPASALAEIFGGREPLRDESLMTVFQTLLGLGQEPKPFECVGDIGESRTAAALAADRSDRYDNTVLASLVEQMGSAAVHARTEADRFLAPLGDHAIPSDLLSAALA